MLLNQGDLIVSGRITQRVVLKPLLTPLIPFCVTMMGALLNNGKPVRVEDLRPGRAAMRRSVTIAVVVGSTIVALNQGDILWVGTVTPLVLVKLLLTRACLSAFLSMTPTSRIALP